MKKSDESFVKNWEHTMKRGRLRFTLLIGLPFGIFLAIIMVWTTEGLGDSFKQIISNRATWKIVFFNVLSAMIIYAQGMWYINSWQYKRILKKHSSKD